MLGLWVVPRFTRSALKRKLIFLKGAGGQKGDFLGDFLAFSLGTRCAHGHALRLHPLLRLRLRHSPR